MPKENRFWPSQAELEPREAGIWIPMNNELAVAPIPVTESRQSIKDRLGAEYPLFKIATKLGLTSIINARKERS